jgi:hypothetical protein
MDLFGNNKEIIRTLGFYQPFCSLMLHGKIETRWVREGKKPPFPKGKYLFYSTKKACTEDQLQNWCGWMYNDFISPALLDDNTAQLNGYALAVADLKDIRLMSVADERMAFVKYMGYDYRDDKDGNVIAYVQWCLEFENVQAIEPFEFKFGKQGIGILPDSERHKINIRKTLNK